MRSTWDCGADTGCAESPSGPRIETREELLTRVFLQVNAKELNVFQTGILKLVLDHDAGPEEYSAAINLINLEANLLTDAGFRPERKHGDQVLLPDHYSRFPMEPIFFIVETGLPWCIACFVKYVCRYRFKNGTEDLLKAARNLAMHLRRLDGDERWSL